MSESHEKPSGAADDRLMDHQYDGIQEYDNPMPRWWVWIYWGSFWFSVAYVFHYWVGNGVSVLEAYDEEAKKIAAVQAEAAQKQEVSEATLEKLMNDTGTVEKGNQAFQSKCVACHLEEGQGSIGPNLTDAHWIHGKGTLMDIYQVVAEGSLQKGMPAWNRQLKPEELRAVVAFVGTLRGTDVAGKPPEGSPVP